MVCVCLAIEIEGEKDMRLLSCWKTEMTTSCIHESDCGRRHEMRSGTGYGLVDLETHEDRRDVSAKKNVKRRCMAAQEGIGRELFGCKKNVRYYL